jgi:hypothetical protein
MPLIILPTPVSPNHFPNIPVRSVILLIGHVRECPRVSASINTLLHCPLHIIAAPASSAILLSLFVISIPLPVLSSLLLPHSSPSDQSTRFKGPLPLPAQQPFLPMSHSAPIGATNPKPSFNFSRLLLGWLPFLSLLGEHGRQSQVRHVSCMY